MLVRLVNEGIIAWKIAHPVAFVVIAIVVCIVGIVFAYAMLENDKACKRAHRMARRAWIKMNGGL